MDGRPDRERSGTSIAPLRTEDRHSQKAGRSQQAQRLESGPLDEIEHDGIEIPHEGPTTASALRPATIKPDDVPTTEQTHERREKEENMSTIERSIEVQIPASKAYEVWTQFERFPEFMEDVERIEQKDDRHLTWRANFWGKTEEWDAEITEQIPDKRIAWRSETGAKNAGVVTFHRLDDESCKVMLQMDFEPSGITEKVGDALGIATHRIERDLEQFKTFAESSADQIEGWRGEIPARPDAAQDSSKA